MDNDTNLSWACGEYYITSEVNKFLFTFKAAFILLRVLHPGAISLEERRDDSTRPRDRVVSVCFRYRIQTIFERDISVEGKIPASYLRQILNSTIYYVFPRPVSSPFPSHCPFNRKYLRPPKRCVLAAHLGERHFAWTRFIIHLLLTCYRNVDTEWISRSDVCDESVAWSS